MPFCFTRYLYIKEEVRCALLCAILSKRKEEALFWAAELFCSGYEEEVIELLWEIYYDFYAALNPSFETYMIRKCSDASLSLNHHSLIVSIITNICLKPYTTDVYVLRQMFSRAATSTSTLEPNKWCEEGDLKTLTTYILSKPMTPQVMREIKHAVLKWCGAKTCLKMRTPPPSCKVSDRRRFLSHIVQICTLQIYDVPRKNRLNISDKFIDITKATGFVPIVPTPLLPNQKFSEFSKTIRAHNILKMGCKYNINDSGFLPLFDLQRYKIGGKGVLNRYHSEWLYHASATPLWANRIFKCGGAIDVSKKQVTFNDANKEESFYELYGLEPDEQPMEVQNMCLAPINRETHGLKLFCKQFGGLNVFNYDDDLIEAKGGVVY